MTSWDFADKLLGAGSAVGFTLGLLVLFCTLVAGFLKYGSGFFSQGFIKPQKSSLESRLDTMNTRLGTIDTKFDAIDTRLGTIDTKFDAIDTRLDAIDVHIAETEVNHFGHLKNYLAVLNGILLDKAVINNTDKARLDNELKGM